MTPWLLPENRKALEAIWTDFKFSCFPSADFVDGTIIADEFEADVNMAAFAWLKRNSGHTSLTLLLDGEKTITEQLIEEVKAWIEIRENGGGNG